MGGWRLAAMMLAVGVAGCQGPNVLSGGIPPAGCAGLRGAPMISAMLYFGRGTRDHGGISDASWQQFLRDEVTPRFPDGFTVIDAHGQWKNQQTGVVGHEDSEVLNVVAPGGDATLGKLDAIAEAYKREFRQQSVGVSLLPTCAAF
jgi:hypothetical protein